MILLGACHSAQAAEPTLPLSYGEVPYRDLVLKPLNQAALTEPGIPGCRLVDLRPFGWKTVTSGLVVIRSSAEYAVQVESLYQEGYLDYLQSRVEHPDRYALSPEMSYEAFLATCNVFPVVDFEHDSLLGAQAMGTGCTVTFEKHVYQDETRKTVRYEIQVIEEGQCEAVLLNRNLILVPRISPEYRVEFIVQPPGYPRVIEPPTDRVEVTPER
jgi:hypothetical protein